MHRSALAGIAFVVGASCGGSQKWDEVKPEPPTEEQLAQQKAEKERAQLEQERPTSPLVERRRQGFRTKEKCGQGPYRLELDSLSAQYGESLEVYVCAPHTVAGAYRLTVKRRHSQETSYERTYGYRAAANSECVAGVEERAALGPVEGTPSAQTTGPADKKVRGKPVQVADAKKRAELHTLDATLAPTECKELRSEILQHGWTTDRGIALDAHLTLELWSELPNDLGGAVFTVVQRAVDDAMTPERWAAYQAAERAWYEKYRAFIDGELSSGRTRLVDTTVKVPPPPAAKIEVKPPRPSAHATWVPGYWHFEDGAYHWLAGLWRVPVEDVRAQQTAEAPRPPPPPRDEVVAVRAEAPSRRAVWTSGSWQWDVERGVWVWIDGAWRIPPEEGQVWIAPKWEVRIGGGVRLQPGGWSIRIGR